jgi:hypothetical protein
LSLVRPSRAPCSKCGGTDFTARGDGCRPCAAEASREWREANPERCEKQHARFRKRNPEAYALYSLKARAKKIGVPFDLTVDDYFIPEFCPVLGIPLVRGKRGNPGNPEFDRFVPELGYVRGNVTVISARANRLKSNGTLRELERVVGWMRSRMRSEDRNGMGTET